MKLLICDGLNIVRRVYEANLAPDSPEKVGRSLQAALGSFKRALREQEPTHGLVAFDYGGPTWRHELYPDYKAGRKPMYEPLREALPAFIDRLWDELGLLSISKPGLEADDLMATVCLGWTKLRPADPVVVLTTDKDMSALAQYKASVYDQFTGIYRDADWIMKTWGVQPHQVHDVLALVGDPVDHVPGVSRVGVKTAARLLAQYGSVAGILATTDRNPAIDLVHQDKENALLSLELVKFRTEFKLGLKLQQLELPR